MNKGINNVQMDKMESDSINIVLIILRRIPI
jgi:hypothetical protein